jgi:hypothetical protein
MKSAEGEKKHLLSTTLGVEPSHGGCSFLMVCAVQLATVTKN